MDKSELKYIIQEDGVVNNDGWTAATAHCVGDCVGVGGSSEKVYHSLRLLILLAREMVGTQELPIVLVLVSVMKVYHSDEMMLRLVWVMRSD